MGKSTQSNQVFVTCVLHMSVSLIHFSYINWFVTVSSLFIPSWFSRVISR